MILISYDIQDNKLRTKFAKYLKKFGSRLQYSVFEIKHCNSMLNKIKLELDNTFMKQFGQCDSVIIFETSATCKISRYGYAAHDDRDVIVVV